MAEKSGSAPVTLFLAAAAVDGEQVNLRPAAVAVSQGVILACGHPSDLRKQYAADARVIELPHLLLMPAMVNAHAHLDLTHLGPQPRHGDFTAWLRRVMAARGADRGVIAASVHRGLEMSRQAGVGFVGDVAGSVEAVEARLACLETLAVGGVSFVEGTGIGRRQLEGFAILMRRLASLPVPAKLPAGKLALGIAPHAPYSAGLAFYNAVGRFAEERDYRLCTHLAETADELRFVRDAQGPLAELLVELGKADDTLTPTGLHPVDLLEPELRRGGWLAVHCNYLGDEHIRTLAYCRVSVAYCPAASHYFGQPAWGSHRYRDMLQAGINVCLGTDSILCQDPHATQPLGVLPQMRFLHRRDRTDPRTLLRMATTHGLRALGLKGNLATLSAGAPARIVGVTILPDDPRDPLTQALSNDHDAQVIHWAAQDEPPRFEYE